MKYFLKNLMIETTRRCNMSCGHCLRGDAQNIDINPSYIDNLFQYVDDIEVLGISGGEPSLFPNGIQAIIDSAKKYNVSIECFGIVTNGKKATESFLFSVMELYNYCSIPKNCCLQISTDDYHEKINKKNICESLPFYHSKREYISVIPEGKGIEIVGMKDQKKFFKTHLRPIDIQPEYFFHAPCCIHNVIENMIYLNAIGDILPSCELSYKTQKNPKLILENVTNENFNLKTGIDKYNKYINDLISEDLIYVDLKPNELRFNASKQKKIVRQREYDRRKKKALTQEKIKK